MILCSGLSPSKDELWRESDADRRLNETERELALVAPIFTLMRASCVELRKLAGMIYEPKCAESAEQLLTYLDEEFEIIKQAITKSHER